MREASERLGKGLGEACEELGKGLGERLGKGLGEACDFLRLKVVRGLRKACERPVTGFATAL